MGRYSYEPGKTGKVPRQHRREGDSPYGPRSSYSQELADRICLLILEGFSLKAIAQMDGMPDSSTIIRWLSEYEDFYVQYYTTRQLQMEGYVHDMIDIADDESEDLKPDGDSNMAKIARARLRIDTRKWVASKLASKIYGDKVQVDGNAGNKATLVILDGTAVKDEPKMIEGTVVDEN